MPNKLKEILIHIWKERILHGFKNDLFFWSFIGIIVFIGTFGIWIQPAIYDEIKLISSFNPVNCLSYSVPLLSVAIFEGGIGLFSKIKERDLDRRQLLELVHGCAWGLLFSIFTLIGLLLVFTLSFKYSTREEFSWYGVMGGFIVAAYWFVMNARNESYNFRPDVSAVIAEGYDSPSQLMDGPGR